MIKKKKSVTKLLSILSGIALLLCILYIIVVQIGCNIPWVITEESPKVSNTAPNFILNNLDSEEIELNKLKGKVVLIDFWAIFCKPCIIALPKTQEIHEKYSEDELVVLAINVREKEDKIKSFINENGYTFKVLIADTNIIKDYGVRSIPFTVLIDEKGTISYTRLGYRPGWEQTLIYEIEKLLRE